MDAKDRFLSRTADQADLYAAVEQQEYALAAIALVAQTVAALEFSLDAARGQLADVFGRQCRPQILVRSNGVFAHPDLSFGAQKKLAARAARFQIDMRLAGVRQRKLPIDGNMQAAARHETEQVVRPAANLAGVAHIVGQMRPGEEDRSCFGQFERSDRGHTACAPPR